MTENKTTRVYSYEELPEAAKAQIREETRDLLYETADLEFCSDEIVTELEALGFNDVKVHSSIGAGQGDGACFSGQISFNEAAKFLGLPETEDGDDCFFTLGQGGRYSHEYSVRIITEDEPPEGLETALEEWRLAKCREIYKRLCEYLEGSRDNDAVTEFLEHDENEYILTHNGKVVKL